MAEVRAARRVSCTPEVLTIEWADGAHSEYASIWLRDNLPQDREPVSGQRLTDVADLPAAPRLAAADLGDGVLWLTWQDGPRAVELPLAWLAGNGIGAASPPERQRRLWLHGAQCEASRDFAWASPAALRADPAARLNWLTRLLQDGLAFLRDVPATPEALLDTMPLIGRVLETNYGRAFDVRSVPQPENLAYSDRGLGLHTDNPYREPVPGFQALHVLLDSPTGGDSLFADGFAIATHLRAGEPEAFAVLARTAVPFHYRARDAELHAERPLIALAPDGRIAAVHYNSRSIAPLALPLADTARFYDAYRRLALLLRAPALQLRTHLAPGTLVVFDNQRVLHGRTPYAGEREPRHLRGCYLSRDSVWGEAALLRRTIGS